MDRIDLFKELYRRCNGYIELRALLDEERPKIKFIPLNTDLETIRRKIDKFCKDYKDRNIYFGVATRDGKGGAEENVINIPCVLVEIDYKNIPEEMIQGIIDKFPFKPTIIVNSGGGLHLYWLLEKPVDLNRCTDVRMLNDWIRLELGKLGECKLDNIGDIPRILRLPGTVNHKYEHKPLCEIVEINSNTYKLDDFLAKIPAPVTKPTSRKKAIEKVEHSKTKTELEAQVELVTIQIEDIKRLPGEYNYNDWLRVGFALADGLGEIGRTYFHRISFFSDKYDKGDCDGQYDKCLNGNPPDDKITILTFFFMQRKLV
jgi:putative DNA primase/helicase